MKNRLHILLTVCVALVFSTAFLTPCLCAAQVPAEESACPCSESTPTEPEHGHGECGCGCSTAGTADEPAPTSQLAVVVAVEESVPPASSWWSPELLAVLTALFAELDPTSVAIEVAQPAPFYPDLSQTYLNHSSLLI
jgi:hypothetical protein